MSKTVEKKYSFRVRALVLLIALASLSTLLGGAAGFLLVSAFDRPATSEFVINVDTPETEFLETLNYTSPSPRQGPIINANQPSDQLLTIVVDPEDKNAQIGYITVNTLESLDTNEAQLSARYNNAPNHTNVYLQADSQEQIQQIEAELDEAVSERLQQAYEDAIAVAIDEQITVIEQAISDKQANLNAILNGEASTLGPAEAQQRVEQLEADIDDLSQAQFQLEDYQTTIPEIAENSFDISMSSANDPSLGSPSGSIGLILGGLSGLAVFVSIIAVYCMVALKSNLPAQRHSVHESNPTSPTHS